MSIAEGPAYRHEMDKAPTQYNYYEDSKSYQPRHHQSHRYLIKKLKKKLKCWTNGKIIKLNIGYYMVEK